ncbi:MAG: hypothetical protein NC541_06435 [bacterium]|nr:hypothetical protein [bacterium]
MFGTKRGRIVVLLEFLMLAVLLMGCFRKEETVYRFDGGTAGTVRETEGGLELTGSPMELKPGVYQIRLDAALQEGQSIFAQIKCENAYFKALRNNGAYVRSGRESLSLQVYVTDRISDAYVYGLFSGADEENLLRLEVVRTAMGSRIALFTATVFFTVLDFLVLFRRRILTGKITGKRQIAFWGLTAGVLTAYFPYLTDHFNLGEESIFHLRRIDYLRQALSQGGLSEAWQLGNWLRGEGYTATLFYGDLFLYLPAALMLLGFSVMTAYKLFLFVMLILSAGIAWHCFYGCVKEEYAALCGSLLYLWNPYYLYLIYSRAAVGEYLAMAFLPLLCYGVYLLYTGEVSSDGYKRAKWYLILGMSGILQSHLIAAGMAAVFVALTCAVFWRKTFRKGAAQQLAEALGITLAVNAGFLLPRLRLAAAGIFDSAYLTVGGDPRAGIDFGSLFQLLPHWGGAQADMWSGEPVQPGVGILLLLLLYLLWRYKGHRTESACGILAAYTWLAVVLAMEFAASDRITGIPVLGQAVGLLLFSARFLAPAAVLGAMFGAFFFREVLRSGSMRLKFFAGVTALTAVFAAIYLVDDYAFELAPCYLYNVENLGIAGELSTEALLPGRTVSGLGSSAAAGSAISAVSVAVIACRGWYLNRKRVRDERTGEEE